MFTRRLSLLVIAGTAGLLIGGCTSDKPGNQAAPSTTTSPAAPTSAAPTTGSGALSLPPTVIDTTSPPSTDIPTTPPPSNADPDVKAVKGCAGCTVKRVKHSVRPGVSLAVLVAKSTPLEHGTLISYDSGSGRLIDQLPLSGDYFENPALPPTITCDISSHCLVPASLGAHSEVMNVAAVSGAGKFTLTTNTIMVNSGHLAAQDLDGDGIAEITGVDNDCTPACAAGRPFWIAWKLAGKGYIEMGCAPYDKKARPPAKLDPNACSA